MGSEQNVPGYEDDEFERESTMEENQPPIRSLRAWERFLANGGTHVWMQLGVACNQIPSFKSAAFPAVIGRDEESIRVTDVLLQCMATLLSWLDVGDPASTGTLQWRGALLMARDSFGHAVGPIIADAYMSRVIASFTVAPWRFLDQYFGCCATA
jgi:hypothetical protein